MEYNQSFAIGEAIVLVGVVAWLFYLNSNSGRDSDDRKSEPKDDQDQSK